MTRWILILTVVIFVDLISRQESSSRSCNFVFKIFFFQNSKRGLIWLKKVVLSGSCFACLVCIWYWKCVLASLIYTVTIFKLTFFSRFTTTILLCFWTLLVASLDRIKPVDVLMLVLIVVKISETIIIICEIRRLTNQLSLVAVTTLSTFRVPWRQPLTLFVSAHFDYSPKKFKFSVSTSIPVGPKKVGDCWPKNNYETYTHSSNKSNDHEYF